MKPGKLIAAICSIALLAPAFTFAQNYPARPVRLIVPLVPGGSVDALARVLAHKLGDAMHQQFVVDNRGGASGNIGTELVVRAPPDGYTIMAVSMTLVVNPFLFDKLPFDVERDLAPVSLLGAAPMALVAHPSVPLRSVADMIAMAKKQPGKLNYPSGGKGTNSHLPMALFKNMTGADIVHVPYRGGGPAQLALIGGEIDVMFMNVGTVATYVKADKVRGLATTGARRSPLLPELPTVAESGVPGYEFNTWYGVLAPARTPKAIIDALNSNIVKVVRGSDLAQRLAHEGAEGVASSPAQFGAHIKAELARWGRIVGQAESLRAD